MRALIFVLVSLFSSFLFGAGQAFKSKTIQVGSKTLLVELAETPEQAAQGLMFRTQLKEGTGMLFLFKEEEIRTFWMKNTFIPLSIGFFNSKKQLIDIQDMAPVSSELETSPPTYTSASPAKFALEVPLGWFKKNKLHVGAKFTGL